MNILEDFVENAISTGYRGILVLTSMYSQVYDEVMDILAKKYDKILVVAKDNRVCTRNILCIDYADVRKMLGYEFDVVIINVDEGMEPNLMGIVGEMIKGGGLLVLLTKHSYESIRLGIPQGLSYYTLYIKNRLGKAKNVLVMDMKNNKVILHRRIHGKGKVKLTPLNLPGFPKSLSKIMLTSSQYEWLRKFIRFLGSRHRLILGLGDRGRGKSAVLGISIALGYFKGYYSEVPVISTSIYSVQSLFKFLVRVLDTLGVKYRVKMNEDLIVGVELRDGRIYYTRPWEITRGYKLIVLDEAAALGISRLRSLLTSARKIVATTTIHGYEGTGHTSVKVIRSLIKARIESVFNEPVRYPPGDPLEEWLYNTFLLNVDPIEPVLTDNISYVVVEKGDLVYEYDFLRNIYGILVLAHYRNEPNDLALLLDHPKHMVRVLLNEDNQPLGVAQISVEGPLSDDDLRVLELKGSIPGILLLDKMYKYGLDIRNLKLWRIVRIAVPPSIQRKGLGSKLLKHIEDEAISNGIDCIGAIFSGHEALGFWLKNKYRVFYVSPRFNKITGEKNIAVIKALSESAKSLVETLTRLFKRLLLLSSVSVYRDLAAEKIALILSYSNVDVRLGLCLDDLDVKRLRMYLEHKGLLHESYYDSIHKAVLLYLSKRDIKLDMNELTAIVARSIQGKGIGEVAKILNTCREKASTLLENVYRKIVENILESLDKYMCRI